MVENIFCIGNGESRKGFDLDKLKPHGKIYGCNAMYRDYTPDVLCAVDMGIMHEIYNSGYAQNNSCVFRDWNRMPGEMYEQLLWAGQQYSDQDYELVKKENVIKTNERGNCKEFVLHGSNLAGTIEILKKNKERKEKKVNHSSINVSWCTDDDKVRTINEIMQPKDRGWATGPTSGYVAVADHQPKRVFLIGQDLESLDGKLNNIYKDTKHYGLKEAHKTPSINWRRQWRELFAEHPHIRFYKVNPDADRNTSPINIRIDDWEGEKNLEYIDYQALDKMLN